MMRISRPAWMAKDFPRRSKELAISSSSLKPLDVVLERLAARAGAGGRDGVGGLHQHRLDGLRFHVAVVGADGVDDLGVLAVASWPGRRRC